MSTLHDTIWESMHMMDVARDFYRDMDDNFSQRVNREIGELVDRVNNSTRKASIEHRDEHCHSVFFILIAVDEKKTIKAKVQESEEPYLYREVKFENAIFIDTRDPELHSDNRPAPSGIVVQDLIRSGWKCKAKHKPEILCSCTEFMV